MKRRNIILKNIDIYKYNMVNRKANNKKYYQKNKLKFSEKYKLKEKIFCDVCNHNYSPNYFNRHLTTLNHQLNAKYCFVDDKEKELVKKFIQKNNIRLVS